MINLKAIHETVRVYRDHLEIMRDITLGQQLQGGKRSPPRTIPLEWHFPFEGLERDRVPAHLQRK